MGTDRKKLNTIVWISWEKQRRSITLSNLLSADYLELNFDNASICSRYAKSIFISIRKIINNRNSIVIVQNPSMILAFIATLLRKILHTRIIVDRHTDRYILNTGDGLIYKIFLILSNYTLRNSNLTIVTNKELVNTVNNLGGKAFILPDPFPDIKGFINNNKTNNKEKLSCMVVVSWFSDEPIEQIFEAAALMSELDIYISGKPKKSYSKLINNKPDNIHITHYLSDTDFYSLMNQCDFVVAISTDEATLVCGGYEAITLSKPLLTGNSISLQNYFGNAAVYSDGSTNDIVKCMNYIIGNLEKIRGETEKLYSDRSHQWEQLLRGFKTELENI